MKILSLLALSLLAASVISNNVSAANGTLQFNGNLNNPTCTISDRVGGTTGDILLNLGRFSFNNLATANPGVGSVSGFVANFRVVAQCADADAYNGIVMRLDPQAGTGVDAHDNRLLALSPGGARGAAIAVIDSNRNIIDMGSAPKISQPFEFVDVGTGNRIATLRFGAAYLKTTGAQVPGLASASVPFVVTYE